MKDLTTILWNEHHREDAEYIRDVLLEAGYDVDTLQAEILWKLHSEVTMAASWLLPKSKREVLACVEKILAQFYSHL